MTGRRKSLPIDKTFPGVGRIALRSDTDNVKMRDRYKAMLDALYAGGRLDVLRAIKQRVVTIPEVWDLYRPMHGRVADLGKLPSPETRRRLFKVDERLGADDAIAAVGTAFDEGVLSLWLRGKDCSTDHRDALASSARALARAGSLTAVVADLPVLLVKVRAHYLGTGQRVMGNRVRQHLTTFAKETLGRSHHLYGQLLETPTLKTKAKAGRPMEPDEARAFCAYLDAHSPGTGRALWAMCTTGMGPREYWETPWELAADRVLVHGTKRDGRERIIPVVDRAALAVGPQSKRSTVDMRIYEACTMPDLQGSPFRGKAIWPTKHVPYDGRRTFAHWMSEAGIERPRRRAYLGHGADDITALYERAEVIAHLAKDAERLRTYLGLDDAPGLRLVSTEGA